MKKYEYRVITIATNMTMTTKQYEKTAQEFEAKLNELGILLAQICASART